MGEHTDRTVSRWNALFIKSLAVRSQVIIE
mgnify:CR=1 FL=1